MWVTVSDERTFCRLQLLLALASALIIGSGSRGTHDHTLLSQIRDFPHHRLALLTGPRWRYSTPPPHCCWLVSSLYNPLGRTAEKNTISNSSSVVARELVAVGTSLFRGRYLVAGLHYTLLCKFKRYGCYDSHNIWIQIKWFWGKTSNIITTLSFCYRKLWLTLIPSTLTHVRSS
jgi:hypothetical protein